METRNKDAVGGVHRVAKSNQSEVEGQPPPAAHARLVFDHGMWKWFVQNCPICKESHLHDGEFPGRNPRETLTQRTGQCNRRSSTFTERRKGYQLVDWPEETAVTLAEYAAGVERKAREKGKGVSA